MKDQVIKFRCTLVNTDNLFRRKHIEEDFEYVVAGHHYTSLAKDEVLKYLREQFGFISAQMFGEKMKSRRYWIIKINTIGDRGLNLGGNKK